MIKIVAAILCSTCLIACAPLATTQIVRTEYIRQQIPPRPQLPDYYPVEWGVEQGKYYVDETGAKNVLKNRELDKSYQAEVESIFNTMEKSGKEKN
jgi:hypothetical protein